MKRLLEALDELDALEREATPGEWGYDSYARVWQSPDSPGWNEDDEALLYCPVKSGDTATDQGASDLALVAALRNAYPLLSRALRASLEIVDMRDSDLPGDSERDLAAIEAELEARR